MPDIIGNHLKWSELSLYRVFELDPKIKVPQNKKTDIKYFEVSDSKGCVGISGLKKPKNGNFLGLK